MGPCRRVCPCVWWEVGGGGGSQPRPDPARRVADDDFNSDADSDRARGPGRPVCPPGRWTEQPGTPDNCDSDCGRGVAVEFRVTDSVPLPAEAPPADVWDVPKLRLPSQSPRLRFRGAPETTCNGAQTRGRQRSSETAALFVAFRNLKRRGTF